VVAVHEEHRTLGRDQRLFDRKVGYLMVEDGIGLKVSNLSGDVLLVEERACPRPNGGTQSFSDVH
jgi:hypothetical protein